MVESAFAQSVPKPSVPEFTLKIVHRSYDHPAIYKIDPYTGENVTIVQEKHDESTEIVATIKNQPFTPYEDSDGNWIELYYNVQSKGHFGDSWNTISYLYDNGWLTQSDSDYTTRSFPANSTPTNAQVDFRVQAMIGYFHDVYYGLTVSTLEFVGETSDWSNILTLRMSDGTVTQSPSSSSPTTTPDQTPTPSPTNYTGVGLAETEIILIVAIAVAGIGAGLGLLGYSIKRK